MDPHSRTPKKNTSHGNEVLPQDTTHLIISCCWRGLSCPSHFDHLNTNELWHRFRSAYRARHPTETTLLRVLNHFLTAGDDGRVSLFNPVDLSADFDTIDHDILLHRLENVFGIQNSALSFFRSHFTERKQMVSISGYSSNSLTLLHGVPQGSLLGPIPFLLHTQPLSSIIDRHSVSHCEFADNSQLWFSCTWTTWLGCLLSNVQSYVEDAKLWMTQNNLQLNEGKIGALLVDHQNSPNLPISVKISQNEICFSRSVRN